MEKIDYEVDDFMNYCDYKCISQKSMKTGQYLFKSRIMYKF